MYPQEFDYHRPASLAEASRLLAGEPDAKLLAGGHSLLPAMKLRLAAPAALIDIGRLPELRGIRTAGAFLEIGALATHAEVASSEVVRKSCPLLAEAATTIGDLQVRNRGTLGGSLAHADPAADYPSAIVALGATVIAAGAAGSREVPAEGFFKDLFTPDLRPGEILTRVRVPGYGQGTGGCYLKHRHPASSYAVVGVAALVTVSGGKCARMSLVVGGATATPLRARAAEAALTGQAPDEAALAAAAARVPEAIADPLGDHYASGDFRRHLAMVLAKRALASAARRALA
jgi:carbon-monoxide dehydrogenase medium subunit